MTLNNNVTFPGVPNLSVALADQRNLLLQVFSGEVITQFNKQVVMKELHMQKSITEGKSASFPVLGRVNAVYHKPGNDIMNTAVLNEDSVQEMQLIANAEKVIFIDDLLIAPVFLDKLEEKLNHYDSRAPYAKELGRALARAFDSHAIRTAIAGGRTLNHALTAGPNPPKGGGILLDADFKTNGSSAAGTIFRIAAEMNFRNLPKDGRHILVDPGTFLRLSQQTDLISRDFNPPNGSLSEGEVFKIAGIFVHESVALPDGTTNEGVAPGTHADVPGAASAHVKNDVFGGAGVGYGGTAAGHAAIAFHESAIGTLTAMELQMESQYIIERQGDLMLAKMAVGHDVLRTEACIEVQTAGADVNITTGV